MSKISYIEKISLLENQKTSFNIRHDLENENCEFRETHFGIINDEDFYSWRKSEKIKINRFYDDEIEYYNLILDNILLDETLIEHISEKHLKQLKSNLMEMYIKINK